MKTERNWSALPADLPAHIRTILTRCLVKDRKSRIPDLSVVRYLLDETASSSPAAPVAARVPVTGMARRERAIWAALATIAAAVAVWMALPSSSSPADALPMARFEVLPPGDGRFIGTAPRMAISPDGRLLAFSASAGPAETDQLWIRRLDSIEAVPVPGSQSTPEAMQPQSPFWSPDSRQLAFFVQTGLESVGLSRGSRLLAADMTGGAVRKICDLRSNNASGSWNNEGVLLVSSQGTNGIQRVAASGGVPTQVTTLDDATNYSRAV